MPVTSGASWLRTFHPEWPALAGIDTVKVKFTYWQEIDTLFVDLSNGVPRRVNVPSDEDRSCFFLRVDVDIEDIVKRQIEDFLGCAIDHYPFLLDGLDWAELRGITRGEIAQAYPGRVTTPRTPAAVAAFLDRVKALVKLPPDA